MESSASPSSGTSESRNPAGFVPPRKRPRGALKGIGFILAIWVQQVFRRGVLPTLRSLPALMAIADVVDADGRWCYFLLENLAQRSGGVLSVSSLKRAIDDLVEAGVVRKLDRSETIVFFDRDIARGRSSHHLPCVLELLVPAEDYPDLVLEEINACRARLGEEPLTPHTRPSLRGRRTPAQIEPAPRSDRPTDRSPGDSSDGEAGDSVRGASNTGEQKRQSPSGEVFELIDHIPGALLADPETDRNRLAGSAERLLRQGLRVADVRALLAGAERLRRPFPALMRRLCDMRAARAYLDGALGRGIARAEVAPPSWPVGDDTDPFAHPARFLVDSRGRSAGTCPHHPAVRNTPGGTCVICGRPCRSVPDEIVHEPKPLPAAPSPAVEQATLDPELRERMAASLRRGGPSSAPSPHDGHRGVFGSGISPRSRALIDHARERLDRSHCERRAVAR
ncbi:hypothetical protein [Nocardiopsis sp. NPDC058789]|uniref:hypothetical protein n=1 Tax=Nocardiopsis sp. NPDC058789 TaxID=3346634 RepID=UPI00366B7E1B